MTNKKIGITTELDATGVKQGAEEAKASVRDMAQAVKQSGAEAGAGLAPIGEGAKKGADATERETRRMTLAIQRATVAAEAGGRSTAAFYETIANQRGLNVDALRPYLDSLRKAEEAQQAARNGMDGLGMSAKQTAAALRGVPAQFTDIATSLASGQAPLTVFLQQGGQLKDMFGGAGAAAQALGGYVVGLVNPFSVAAVAIGSVAVGFLKGREEASAFAAALVTTGNAAGTTVERLSDMAASVDAVAGTQAKAASVLAQLAASGEVGAVNLERFTLAAVELERAGGASAEKTVEAFADLGRKPAEAVLKLNESQRFLTASLFAQIQALQAQGRETEAARIAQEAYASAIEQRAPQLEARLGLVERAWRGIKDATKGAADALLNVGRADTVQQRIDQLERAREALLTPAGGFGGREEDIGRELGIIEQRLAALRETQKLAGAAATSAAERTRQEEAGIQWLQEGNRYLSDRRKLEQEVEQIRARGLAAGIAQAEIEERVAIARSRAVRNPSSGGQSEEERRASLLAQLSGLTATYAQDLARLKAMLADGTISQDRYAESVRQLVAVQPVVKKGLEDMARAVEREAKATADALKARDQYLQGLDRQLEGGERTLEQLRDEVIGMTAGQAVLRQRIALRREEQAVALEMQAIRLEDKELDSEEAARLRERARQVREQAQLEAAVSITKDNQAADQAAEASARKLLDEYTRAADQAGQALADAIMNGGQKAGELLRNYFRTLVLRPVVEAVVRPFASAVSSIIAGPGGGGGFIGAAGTAMGLGSMSGLGSIFSARSAATMAGNGIGSSMSAAGSMMANGQIAQGASFGAGAFAPLAAAAVIGAYLGRAISNGYSVGGSGNALPNLLGVSGGLINRAFGRKLVDAGVQGTFSTDGFSGESFEFLKGGTFRSDKTRIAQVDSALADVLSAGARAATAQVQEYARVLGLPVDAVEGFTQSMKVSLKGLSQEQAAKAIEKAVMDFQEGLAGRYADAIAVFRRGTETAAEALQRLTGLEIFAQGINDLGNVFSRVAGLSFDAREELLNLAGGLDAFNAKALNFVQNFYNRDEIAGLKARDLQQQLAELGITDIPNSRDEFRAIVERTDVTTAAGREQLVALLDLAGPAAEVLGFLEEAGKTLAEAAAAAPESAVLGDALLRGSDAQLNAINRVGDGIDAVVSRIGDLINAVRDPNTSLLSVLAPGMPSEIVTVDTSGNAGGFGG